MGKFSTLLLALMMLGTGSFLLLLDPTLPPSAATATITEAVTPLPAPQPKLVNSGLALPLTAQAYISTYIAPGGEVNILIEKDGERPWPVASISKLLAAMVVLDHGGLDEIVTVSANDLRAVSDPGLFQVGQSFSRRGLLHSLLIESSNNAATILASQIGIEKFVMEMNEKATELGLRHTHFLNPNGLDLADGKASNYSTAEDLVQTAAIITKQYPEIWEISILPEYGLSDTDGRPHHQVKSTNKLLNETHSWPVTVVGGKTGQTDLAKKNLLLVFRDNKTGGQLINIVLGSADHFADMIKLTDWVYQSYQF